MSTHAIPMTHHKSATKLVANTSAQRSKLTFTVLVLLVTACFLVSTTGLARGSTVLLLLLSFSIPEAVEPLAFGTAAAAAAAAAAAVVVVVVVVITTALLTALLLQLVALLVALVSTSAAVIAVSLVAKPLSLLLLLLIQIFSSMSLLALL
jgi:hypothetical protein